MAARAMLLLAFILLLAISTTSGHFSCPKDLPCSCQRNFISDDNEYDIYCGANSATDSGFFYTVINPKNRVRIWCTKAPDWSHFLQGSNVVVGPVDKFVFINCSPPGPMHSTRVIESQMNVQDVKYLEYENLKAPLSAEDLDVFPHVKHLVLSKNRLGEVPQDLLRGLPHLEQLDLMNAQIKIPQGFFDQSSSLEMLELSFNDLKFLTPGIFDGLKRIKVLNLEMNNFQELKPDVFRRLRSLVALNINQNKLKTLPESIFADLKNLEIIEFGEMFTSLPANLFFHNPKLKIVKLSGEEGNLTTLPARLLSNFVDLKVVSLMGCGFLYLPEDLFWGSTSITELDLSRNHLRTLSIKIFKDAADLQTLSLSSNDLKHLDAGIFSENKKLVKLDLSKNHLTFIEEYTFTGLESLQELNINYNDLSDIHVDAFATLKQLKIASFAHNKLKLPIGVGQFFRQFSPFHQCSSLEELDLSHNNITEMFIDWILSRENLQKLDLSYNNIESLTDSDQEFMMISSIEVDFSFNNFLQVTNKFTGERYFDPDSSRFLLLPNPVDCEYNVSDFVHHLNSQMDPRSQGLAKLANYTRKWYCKRYTKEADICTSDDWICFCSKRLSDNALLIDCSGRNLTTPPEWIDTRGVDLVELDLSMNELRTVPNMRAKGYDKVVKLNLADNKIATVEESLITPNLKILNLNGNNLTSINSDFLLRLLFNESNISQLTLRNNPLSSDCSSRDLHYFVRNAFKRYPDLLNISCRNSNASLLTILILICFSFVLLAVAITALYVMRNSVGLSKKIDHHQENNCVETANNRAIFAEKQINQLKVKTSKIIKTVREISHNLADNSPRPYIRNNST